MIITITSFKGGVGKTTTAVHLAGCFQQMGPTLLVDGDLNQSATAWAEQEKMPFEVCPHHRAAAKIHDFEHVIIDTAARPTSQELKTLADSCDYLVIPTTPDTLALRALLQTVETLRLLEAVRYKVLLTRTPPPPRNDTEQAKALLKDLKVPIFKSYIRQYAAFEKAALQGVLVHEARDDAGRKDRRAGFGWEDYCFVGKEILRDEKQVQLSTRITGRKAANG